MAFTHEIETAFVNSQYAKEDSWGVAKIGGYTKFVTSKITPGVKAERKTEIFNNTLLPSIMKNGKEYTEISIEGIGSYEELPLMLGDFKSDSPYEPASYTIEHAGIRIPGCVISSWEITGDTSEIKVNAHMIGKKAVKAGPSTGSAPSKIHVFDGINTIVKIGDAAVKKVFSWSVSMDNIWTPVYFIGSSEPSNIAQVPCNGDFTINVPADDYALGMLTSLDTIPVEISNTETLNGTTYGFKISFDVRFDEPDTFSDEDGVYAVGLKGKIMAKQGKAVTVVVTQTGG